MRTRTNDLLIADVDASPNGIHKAGSAIVVLGKAAGFTPSLDLADIDGTNGFRINGMIAEG